MGVKKKERDLFSVRPSEEMVKKKKKKKRTLEEDDKDGLTQKKQKADLQDNAVLLEPLKYSTISEGQLILGCVSEVRNYEVVVSLPGRMMGIVPLTLICKAYTEQLRKVTESEDDAEDDVSTLQELFKPGQYFVTRVSSCETINGRVKVVLSLKPEDVNFGLSVEYFEEGVTVLSCAVTSVEDNGFVVDTGLKNVRAAFIPKSATKNAGIVGIGTIVRCVITSIGNSEAGGGVRLSLSADPKVMASVGVDVSDTTNLATLLPGTCIATNIEKVLAEGLIVTLGSFDGVVGSHDLINVWDQLIQYKAGQEVRVRVLYVTPIAKTVHLTLASGICSNKINKDPLHGYEIGQIIEDAEVYSASRAGVCFKLGEKCRGFCSGNNLTDKKSAPKSVKSDFPLGSKHKSRIIHFDYMEKFFIVSLQKSVLDQQALHYKDVKVGSKLRATIKGYDDQGAQVAISKTVNAVIPRMHLTDTRMKHPERKYPVGETVTGRVLKVFPEKRQLHLTLKTHLVGSEEIIVDRYSEEFSGKITEGMISKVNKSGLLVSMYQNVRGFVPKRMASTEPVDDLSSVFTAGSVVKCRVMEVNEQEEKMVLSMVIDGLKPFGKHKDKKFKENKFVHVRDKVNCEVVSKTPEGIVVTIEGPEQALQFIIPIQHLSDFEANCQVKYDLLRIGDKIENAVVFRKDATTATLTLKPSIVQWLNTTPTEIIESDDYTEGNIYPCVVSEIRQYGALVSIPAGKYGRRLLVHNSKLTDQYVSNGFDVGFVTGQSLTVLAKGKDDKDREVISSTLRDNMKNIIESSLQLLNNNIKDLDIMREGANSSSVLHKLSKLQVSQKVSCTVIGVAAHTVVVQVGKKSKGVIGVINRVEETDTYTEGQVLHAKVLHVDFANQLVIVSNKVNVVDKLVCSDSTKVNVGQTVKCEVLLARKDFIMVMLLSKHSGLVAYLPSQRHLNDFMGRHSLFTVGREYKMVVKHIEGSKILGVLKQHNKVDKYIISDERPCVTFNSVADEVEDVEINQELGTTQVIAKMERIRFDSQCSNISLEDTVEKVVEEEKVREEREARKLAQLEKDSIPQYDTEGRKQAKKILQKENKRKRQAEKQKLWEEKHKKDFLSLKKEDDSGVASEDDKDEDDSDDEDDSPSKRPCLEIGTGFVWDIPQESHEVHSSSDSEDESKAKQKKSKKKSKLERAEQAKAEERRLVEEEKKRLDASRLPQSALDFEELLQKTPNSSEVWIQFISFHLESAEVDKAKAVARRALELINVREEEERLNIWTVLLRLEVLYGTEESVETAYKEAITTNDQLKIHIAMAMVYEENNKTQEAENVYRVMTKKFSQNLDVWIRMGIFYFKVNKLKEARTLMDKALLSLEKKIHVELINRFAQLEFKFGESERGRTMFETLLSNYPKRTDIWSVYAALLTKQKDTEGARHVLERMTGLKLRMRKMRFVFKKLMDFEKEHGTPQSVEAVKKRVEEYVTSALHDD